MITKKLEVIKKNRVYFKCKNEAGYFVKLRVTPESENLELGIQDLIVNDVSVRTKYGVDIIYELVGVKKEDSGIITLKHHAYNSTLVSACKQLGGRWDAEEKVWVFDDIVEDQVQELDYLYNTEIVPIEIEAKGDISVWHNTVDFCGYTIARAYGRDSGAKLGDGVSKIKGGATSGGSMKNWTTEVSEGSVFRLKVSRPLIEKYLAKEIGDQWWEVTYLWIQ